MTLRPTSILSPEESRQLEWLRAHRRAHRHADTHRKAPPGDARVPAGKLSYVCDDEPVSRAFEVRESIAPSLSPSASLYPSPSIHINSFIRLPLLAFLASSPSLLFTHLAGRVLHTRAGGYDLCVDKSEQQGGVAGRSGAMTTHVHTHNDDAHAHKCSLALCRVV